MENVEGKKLLVLGAGSGTFSSEADVVRIAQEMGITVIATDNRTDWTKARAKLVADRAWDISWSDIDLLVRKCLEEKIDGVFASFGEHKVDNAAKLCKALCLPFYTEGASLDRIFNKTKFKRECERAGVDCPKHYDKDDELPYPIVVKPADEFGSRGISICTDAEKFRAALDDAYTTSTSGQIEIEEYIDGDEAFFYYIVRKGVISFLASGDLCTFKSSVGKLNMPIAQRYPSVYQDLFLSNYDGSYRKLIKNLNINNGVIGFQCFVKDGRILVHDPTYRIDGSPLSDVLEEDTGTSPIRLLIKHSLTGEMGSEEDMEQLLDPSSRRAHFQIGAIVRPGTIGAISGLDKIVNMSCVTRVRQFMKVGDCISSSASPNHRCALGFRLSALDLIDLKKKLDEVFKALSILDSDGKDLLVRFNSYSLASKSTLCPTDLE